MEQKTAEEIVKENFKGLKDLIDDEELLIFYKKQIKICLIDYAKQQQEIAVEKALTKCSAMTILHSSELAERILRVKQEILKELEK